MIVFDTNIILLDANNIFAFPGKTIVIPETVVDELDNKKSDSIGELAYQARAFGRILSKAKPVTVTKTDPLTVSEYISGDTVIHIVASSKYQDFKDTHSNIVNDRKIIEIAWLYTQFYPNETVTFMSNDVMARIRASAEGILTAEYKLVESVDSVFTKHLSIPSEQFDQLDGTEIKLIDPEYLPENYNYVFTSPTTGQTKLATITNGCIDVLDKDAEAELRKQDISPMNVEQLFLSKHLQDPLVPLVICESLAGSGLHISPYTL